METHAHQQLKRLAMVFLRECGCLAVAGEVRCPIARYRLDVAGYRDAQPREPRGDGAANGRLPGRRNGRAPARTIIIECKQSREDFFRQRADRDALLSARHKLDRIRQSIEENRIKVMEPHLRRSDGALFSELEQWDFNDSRLPGYHAVLDRLSRIDTALHGGTKFSMIARYRLADRLYIAAPRAMIQPRELPPGWGLLECSQKFLEGIDAQGTFDEPATLSVRVPAPKRLSQDKFRQRLLRNIAVAASQAMLRAL